MKFNTKNYKTIKTKNYIKTNNLFFFFNGINHNSSDWVFTEQALKTLNYKYYKVLNKTAIKTLKGSIYTNTDPVINGVTLFIIFENNDKPLSKNVLINKFESLTFILLAVKINNKIYSAKEIKNSSSLNYSENKLLFYQFGLANLKKKIERTLSK